MEVKIPITIIKPDKNQPRREAYRMETEIAELAESIQATGLINPIEVDESNTIVTGELRYRAAVLAGLDEVPIRKIKISKDERLLRQVAENLHHNLMTPMDTARAIKQLYVKGFKAGNDELPQDQGYAKLGRLLGKSPSFVKDMLDLAGETSAVQRLVESGKVPYTALRDANAFPEQHREEVRTKVLKGEIKRDALKPLKYAVTTQPDKAEELLNQDYSGKTVDSIAKIREIAPHPIETWSDQVDKDNELIRAIEKLTRLLETNYFSEADANLQLVIKSKLERIQRRIDQYLVTSPSHRQHFAELENEN